MNRDQFYEYIRRIYSTNIFYEYIRQADLNTVRNLCSTNRYYYSLCNTEPFQRLIKQKYDEMIDRHVTKWEREILANFGKGYFFELDDNHRIIITADNIREEVPSYQQ